MKKIITITSVMLLIASCSSRYASNGENVYLNSKNGFVPVVNSPLTSSNISNFYDLPHPSQNPEVSINPPV